MTEYHVYFEEYPEDGETIEAKTSLDAVQEYLELCDRDSRFVDGYPQGEVICVIGPLTNPDDPLKFFAYTEFEPVFYFEKG